MCWMRYGIEEDWQKKLRRYFMDYIVRWVVVAGSAPCPTGFSS